MADSITIGLLQREILPLDPPANLLAALDMLHSCAKQDIDLFVMTEMWSTGILNPDDPSALDFVEEIEGPTVEALREFCRESKSYLLAGSLPLREQGALKNTSLLINPDGRIIIKYSKTQLFAPMGEDKVFTPGNSLAAVDINGVGVGVLICYDVRFPGLARRLAKAGCEVIIVPALWPESRIDHWEILIRARAIENQIYVAGANGVLNQGSKFYPGHSLIVNPAGELLNSPEMREAAIVRKLDINHLRQLRREICYIDDEREVPELDWIK
jgi:omega-amidase